MASDGGGKSYAHAVVTARSFTEKRALCFYDDDCEDRVDYLIHEAFRTGSLQAVTFVGRSSGSFRLIAARTISGWPMFLTIQGRIGGATGLTVKHLVVAEHAAD